MTYAKNHAISAEGMICSIERFISEFGETVAGQEIRRQFALVSRHDVLALEGIFDQIPENLQ